MTQTAVTTVEASQARSSGSLSIRAGSPQRPEATISQQTSSRNAENIELAPLPSADQAANVIVGTPIEPFAGKDILWKHRIQYAALCWALFLVGWNDGTTGPLLPRIQDNYHASVESSVRFLLETHRQIRSDTR